MIGCFILASHHLLVLDWRLLITVIGYWGVLKGAALLILPRFDRAFRPMIGSQEWVYRVSGAGWILIGIFLSYQGFWVG